MKAKIGAPVGKYELRVQSLVQSQQSLSAGLADREATVPAGPMTIEVGDNSLLRETPLSELNGGAGVSNGKFRLTDRTGNAAIFDTGDYRTLEELVEAINFELTIDVEGRHRAGRARARGQDDRRGHPPCPRPRRRHRGGRPRHHGKRPEAQPQNARFVAAAPGGVSVSDAEVVAAAREIDLSELNGGNPFPTFLGNELRVRDRDFQAYDIDLDGVTTVGDLVDRFNAGTGGAVVMSLDPDNGHFVITDQTGRTGDELEVQSNNLANVAELLGINVQAGVNDPSFQSTKRAFDPDAIRSELYAEKIDNLGGTPDRPGGIKSEQLRGGKGIDFGTFVITDRNGDSATIDAFTPYLDDVLVRINNSGVGVAARLNDAGNGIVLEDTTGGEKDLVISDDFGNAAADLGISGTYNAAHGDLVNSGNLQRAFITADASLATYNIGKPVGEGTIQFTDSGGATAELDLHK